MKQELFSALKSQSAVSGREILAQPQNGQTIAGAIVVISVAISFLLCMNNFLAQKNSMAYHRVVWVLAFLLNVITVSIPGRFDSQAANINDFPWRTLFAPSGWAFAIWGVIYLGEMILTLYLGATGKPEAVFQRAGIFWLAGNTFQSLWCGVFRPKYLQNLWLPASQLALAGLSFSLLHREMTMEIFASKDIWTKVFLGTLRVPISLHTGWLAAATLLNTNAWIAVSQAPLHRQTSAAVASVYLAAFLAAYLTYTRRDPFIALTVAWAIFAISKETETTPVNVPDIVKNFLSETEKAVAAALLAFALVEESVQSLGLF